MRAVFILVPSFHPTGPVKGAVALANALVDQRDVALVALKNGPGVDAFIDPRVRRSCLARDHDAQWPLAAYRHMLRSGGGRQSVASISACFSADMVNLFCRDLAVTCSSVRGNLMLNYRFSYGPIGLPLAAWHLAALRWLDHVVAMNNSMARAVSRFIGRVPVEIGNFVDEGALEGYRDHARHAGPLRLVFLGSLTRLKQPQVLVEAFASLRAKGVSARLHIAGDGPLRDAIDRQIQRSGLAEVITLHGHLQDPYPLLAGADALVLPSLSEGTARAALEALHLGVPCVLRNAGGNSELIESGVNGMLFQTDEDLPDAMLAAARLGRRVSYRVSLLPATCRQQEAAARYLRLVEST